MGNAAPAGSAILSTVTLGVVNINPDNGNVVVKDPVTSALDFSRKARDVLFHDPYYDVW